MQQCTEALGIFRRIVSASPVAIAASGSCLSETSCCRCPGLRRTSTAVRFTGLGYRRAALTARRRFTPDPTKYAPLLSKFRLASFCRAPGWFCPARLSGCVRYWRSTSPVAPRSPASGCALESRPSARAAMPVPGARSSFSPAAERNRHAFHRARTILSLAASTTEVYHKATEAYH